MTELMRLIAISLLLTASVASQTGLAQESPDLDALAKAEAEARATEQRLTAERKAVTKEIDSLKTVLARDTEQTQAYERERTRLEQSLEDTNQRISALESELSVNRDDTQTLLASLQRLQMAPSIATVANPDSAVRTAQAAAIIDSLSSQLQARAAEIRSLSETLEAARIEAIDRQSALNANAAELLRRKARTQSLVAQKEALLSSIRTDETKARAEAARLAAESANLRELLDRVVAIPETVRPRLKPGQGATSGPVTLPPGTLRFAEAKGGLVRPVSGRLSKAFGRGEKGQTYSAPSGGQVLAPYAGRVEFAGPFRNYGRVVILNMGDEYYLLLTGLDGTFVATGESVKRGEPVGRMPRTNDRAPLYMELRRKGRTIDPSPWMGG